MVNLMPFQIWSRSCNSKHLLHLDIRHASIDRLIPLELMQRSSIPSFMEVRSLNRPNMMFCFVNEHDVKASKGLEAVRSKYTKWKPLAVGQRSKYDGGKVFVELLCISLHGSWGFSRFRLRETVVQLRPGWIHELPSYLIYQCTSKDDDFYGHYIIVMAAPERIILTAYFNPTIKDYGPNAGDEQAPEWIIETCTSLHVGTVEVDPSEPIYKFLRVIRRELLLPKPMTRIVILDDQLDAIPLTQSRRKLHCYYPIMHGFPVKRKMLFLEDAEQPSAVRRRFDKQLPSSSDVIIIED